MLGRYCTAHSGELLPPRTPPIFVYKVNYFFSCFGIHIILVFLSLAKEIVVISLLMVLNYSLFSNALYFIVQRESS